ncbi:AraC-type DNA-binding protein [Chitinophaga ginsengisegetis]|uniref:AraC-type DNA-binding protein n=1 Tax=Chitinophaga ginsengisegetis TaxID=393003 RepID=A0A1T5NBD2_9BACT|nr:helix-turn-helix domain-containing protein [Chitinophaga ginsengisegetis]SKC97757.1 AraC-type DNA-binding protein [Chitinophaga ginsengisegetis]
MKMEFYRPVNEILQRYIEGYYFISPGKNSEQLHYWTFPNNYFIVSVSRDIEIEAGSNKITVRPSRQENIVANFVSRYIAPIEVIIEGGINEITIYFKPLAINYFLDNAHELFEQENAVDFNPFADFIPAMKQILLEDDRNLQRESLEDYWISKLNPREPGLMERIISDIESGLKIEEIARNNNFSRQYLNRLFTRNIGKSPSEFYRIHRFRKAIAKQRDVRNLTELSYESLFYDQSHLIKDFKQLTNVNPYTFFKKVDTDSASIWLFI